MKKAAVLLCGVFLFAQSGVKTALKKYKHKEYKEAFRMFNELCERNSSFSCYAAGFMISNNKVKTPLKAEGFFKKGCELGNNKACLNLGYIYEKRKEYKKAFTYYKKACEMKNYLACNNLGVLYQHGEGVKKDIKKAAYYFKTACEHNVGLGCLNLGILYQMGIGIRYDYQKAVELFKKACSLRVDYACSLIPKNIKNKP